MVDPPKKFFRLGPGLQVRLKGAYIITCDHFELNADGSVAGRAPSFKENLFAARVERAQAAIEFIAIQRCSFQGSVAKRSTKKSSKARTAGERCLREG